MIVDSTRKGKRFPDSLAKTIPIWCAVMNRAIHRYRTSTATAAASSTTAHTDHRMIECWDMELHCLPSIVPEQEQEQICQRLDGFVDRLFAMQAAVDFKALSGMLRKPLRPLWISPESLLATLPLAQLSFIPVVLCSASMQLHAGQSCFQSVQWPPRASSADDCGTLIITRTTDIATTVSFEYMQGAADDHEMWAERGQTAESFWQSMGFSFKDTDTDTGEFSLAFNQQSDKKLSYHLIGDTGLAIGSMHSCRYYQEFDWIINATAEIGPDNYLPDELSSKILSLERPKLSQLPLILTRQQSGLPYNYCQLFIEEGKRGQYSFARHIPFIRQQFTDRQTVGRVLVHCRQGVDRSVAVALCILLSTATATPTAANDISLGKMDINRWLAIIQRYRSVANPSRALLKRINEHFIIPLGQQQDLKYQHQRHRQQHHHHNHQTSHQSLPGR